MWTASLLKAKATLKTKDLHVGGLTEADSNLLPSLVARCTAKPIKFK